MIYLYTYINILSNDSLIKTYKHQSIFFSYFNNRHSYFYIL